MKRELSIILPVYNEADSLQEVYSSLMNAIAMAKIPSEIIFVNDGSTDDSKRILRSIKNKDPAVKVVNFDKRYGMSNALQAGFDNAECDTIITMDADLEQDPRMMIPMIKKLDEGYDVVCGRRVGRPFQAKYIFSFLGNFVFRILFRTPVRDMACTLRAYKKNILSDLVIRGSLHRYLPVLFKMKGAKIAEVDVEYTPRKYGRSKYDILFRSFSTLKDLFMLFFFRKSMLNDQKREYRVEEIW